MFTNYKQVEAALDIVLTAYQAMLVQNYLDNGVRPPATSCSGCDETYVRRLTARIDAATAPEAEVTEIQDVPRKRRKARKEVEPEADRDLGADPGEGADGWG